MFSMMISADWARASNTPAPICPNCGGTDHEDNRIDTALYREAAREAPRLRHEGRDDEAIDVLTALAAVEIANFIGHDWRCLACGVSFDA